MSMSSEVALTQIDYNLGESGYEVTAGHPMELRGLHAPTIDREELVSRFREANDTYSIITGPSGRQYEVIVFNPGKSSKARIMKPGTSFSGVRKNPANMIEVGAAAAHSPDVEFLYFTPFGNEPTDSMDIEDLLYLSSRGRNTRGTGTEEDPYRALGSIEDAAEALANHNLTPTHFSADAEAGRLALGFMVAFDRDTIKGAYFNGIDGISPSASYVRARLAEDLQSRIRRRGIGEGQPGELTPVNIKEVKKCMPNVYSGFDRIAYVVPLPRRIAHVAPVPLLHLRDVFDKLLLTRGYRGHNNLANLSDHAVYQDMSAALRHQNGPITLQFNKESAVHNVDDCIRFGKIAMEGMPESVRTDERRVRLLIGEGKLDHHTDAPHDRLRTEQQAFSDIMRRMAVVAGGLVTDAQILGIGSVGRETA
jgi:hypothetical protein